MDGKIFASSMPMFNLKFVSSINVFGKKREVLRAPAHPPAQKLNEL
jgi:hypothetical protein